MMISTDYKVIVLVLLQILGLLMNNVNSLQECSNVCELDDNVYTGHCGAFANDPREVAEAYQDVLNEPEFKGVFQRIVFSIMGGKRNGNYQAFEGIATRAQ